MSKSFKGYPALRDVSVSFETGIYALLGPNGSGKSTFMNILTDNIIPDSGSVYLAIDGKRLSLGDDPGSFLNHIGYMPQEARLYPDFTVSEFCEYVAVLKNLPKAEANRNISDIMRSLELDDIKGKKIRTLSGGMKQRLSLAQAIIGSPDILLLDEPTAGLDPKQRISIRNFISRTALSKTVIYATHVVSDIEFIARDIIMLKNGSVIENAPLGELTKKIEGKVWILPCAETEVQKLQKSYRVTNIARDEDSGNVLLRVLSDEKPDVSAKTVAPTLEDYYLYVFDDIPVSTE